MSGARLLELLDEICKEVGQPSISALFKNLGEKEVEACVPLLTGAFEVGVKQYLHQVESLIKNINIEEALKDIKMTQGQGIQ